VILTAHYDEAVRCTALGQAGQAAKLLAPVLDRALLAHDGPRSVRLTRCLSAPAPWPNAWVSPFPTWWRT